MSSEYCRFLMGLSPAILAVSATVQAAAQPPTPAPKTVNLWAEHTLQTFTASVC
jgi:hypothetical protein